MKWYFKAFWLIYLIDIVFSGGLKILDYILKTQLLFLFKVPLLVSFFIIILFHLRYKLLWNKINRLLLIFGIFGLVHGILMNGDTIDEKVFPSIYTFFMPIFSISFGIHYAQNYNFKYKEFTNWIFKYGFIISITIVSIYLFFHFFTGQISYFGFGNELHFVGAYFLANQRLTIFIICVIFVGLSGKRSTTLNILMVGTLYYFKDKVKLTGKNIIILPFVVFLIGLGFNWAYENDYLRRFEETLNFDINDDAATYRATSGRWQEVEGVARKLNENPYQWIIGAGIGAKYLYEDYYYGFRRAEEKHYAHFSPAGYTFLYGIIFTILLYSLIFGLIIKHYKNYHKNFHYLSFCVLIFAAFFGSNLFVSHIPWFFVGVISQFNNRNLEITKE